MEPERSALEDLEAFKAKLRCFWQARKDLNLE